MVVNDRLCALDLPGASTLCLDDVIDLYQALWPQRPALPAQPQQVERLVDMLDHVDGLILDGYGVINVGNGPVEGIEAFFETAEARAKPVVVLTNGASFPAAQTWQKYRDWGLPLNRYQVVSSRDVLEAHLAGMASIDTQTVFGCLGETITPLSGAGTSLAYGRDDDFWDRSDAFLFLGALDWGMADQAALEAAMMARPRPIHVANPDVSAPQSNNRFSAEPGYWAARLVHALGQQGQRCAIHWHGKPNPLAFHMACERLNEIAGKPVEPARIAMVGDSLHTDVLGGITAGLQTVLITDYGLFRGVEITPFLTRCGIRPHWIVNRL
jgi:glycerol 3-phosphatase-2